MSVRQAEIDHMLRRGNLGCLVSMVGLGLALCIRDGREPVLETVACSDAALSEEKLSVLVERIQKVMLVELRACTREEIIEAIAVFSEHLRQAGYETTVGKDN